MIAPQPKKGGDAEKKSALFIFGSQMFGDARRPDGATCAEEKPLRASAWLACYRERPSPSSSLNVQRASSSAAPDSPCVAEHHSADHGLADIPAVGL